MKKNKDGLCMRHAKKLKEKQNKKDDIRFQQFSRGISDKSRVCTHDYTGMFIIDKGSINNKKK